MRGRAVIADAVPGRRGRAGIVGSAFSIMVVLIAASFFLGQVRETVLVGSAEVRQAQARQAVAEADLKTAQLSRSTRAVNADERAAAPWDAWVVAAGRLAVLALLVAVPAAVVTAFVGVVVLLRRHMSLPTADGRVPLVGLDREFSREALTGFQVRVAAARSTVFYEPPAPTRVRSVSEVGAVTAVEPEVLEVAPLKHDGR